jgi:hypothetical protein
MVAHKTVEGQAAIIAWLEARRDKPAAPAERGA